MKSKLDLKQIERALAPTEDRDLPPVHLWDPPFSGDMDIRIARDGSWFHEGGQIHRTAMVRMFSSILRKEDDQCYYLVTPMEKFRIRVEDAPFVATLMDVSSVKGEQLLQFTTNLGEPVIADADHPIRVEYRSNGEPSPYIRVRDNLDALISRNVYYQLAELAEERTIDGRQLMGVESAGEFFILA